VSGLRLAISNNVSSTPDMKSFTTCIVLLIATFVLCLPIRASDDFDSFKAKAEQGDATAQYNVGVCYSFGTGVAKDEVEAVKWYRKSAEQGVATAQYNLGTRYASGTGVAKDEVEAVKWFRKSAEQGYAVAQYHLGVGYAFGTGVAKDEVEAVKWFRKSAEQGDATAQHHLGFCYANGIGVEKDEVEAYAFYNLSGINYDKARSARDELEKKMASSQVVEGQRRTKELKAKLANRWEN